MSSLSGLGSNSPLSLGSLPSSNSSSSSSSSSGSSIPSNQGGLAVSGLISGLDTNAIITGLLATDQAQITLLQDRQQTVQDEQTAFKTVDAKLLALQSVLNQLAQGQNGVFAAKQATVSDSSMLTAAASGNAAPGIYTLRVNSLAQSEQLASEGFDSASSAVTQGTFQIKVGSGAATTITVDSTNNTLQGLANAINSAGAGVTATVVNDGSDSRSQPYRLLLTANQAGADNAITITNNLAADGSGARKPVFDSTYINQAVLGNGFTGTSVPTVNAGAGGYTGSSNNTYTFTVVNGGTVGTDNGITLSYTDSTGQNTGTITLNSSDVNQAKAVAQGLQVQFGSGTLVAGQSFAVDAFVPIVQAATSASVTLGSGGGALTVQNDSNTLNNLINGVTLNLTAADPSKALSLTVSSDTSKASQAVQDFVSAYNDVMGTINTYVSYDPQTGTAGTLLGNGDVLQIQDQVRRIFGSTVSGTNPLMSRLSALGVSMNQDGSVGLDTAKLNSVLSGQVAGVSLADVRNLFALSGSSNNPAIQFMTAGDKTAGGPVTVNISQAATQASMTASQALADSIVIDGTNNSLTVQLDGHTSSTITLASGTYTPAALAAELQSEINGNSDLAGRQVSVGLNGNQLVVTSASYGSNSHVAIGTGTALAALGFAGNEGGTGQDVAGYFVVNGAIEAATGFGQFLQGNATNAHTAGLQVRATLTATQLGSGTSGTVTVSRGIASALNQSFSSLLDPVSGRFQSLDQNLQQNYDALQKEITAQQAAIELHRQQLIEQFTNMESTLSSLQTASSYLSTQLTSLSSMNNGRTTSKAG